MKKNSILLFLLFTTLFLCAQTKTLVLLEVIDRDKYFDESIKTIVRNDLQKAINNHVPIVYETMIRDDIDLLTKEFKYSDAGLISESLLKEINAKKGNVKPANYLCRIEIFKIDKGTRNERVKLHARIVDAVGGQTIRDGSVEFKEISYEFKKGCGELAKILLEEKKEWPIGIWHCNYPSRKFLLWPDGKGSVEERSGYRNENVTWSYDNIKEELVIVVKLKTKIDILEANPRFSERKLQTLLSMSTYNDIRDTYTFAGVKKGSLEIYAILSYYNRHGELRYYNRCRFILEK